ncbi:hypothetical protein BgiBS90_003864, partial [Biomphalaria glabrata]
FNLSFTLKMEKTMSLRSSIKENVGHVIPSLDSLTQMYCCDHVKGDKCGLSS